MKIGIDDWSEELIDKLQCSAAQKVRMKRHLRVAQRFKRLLGEDIPNEKGRPMSNHGLMQMMADECFEGITTYQGIRKAIVNVDPELLNLRACNDGNE